MPGQFQPHDAASSTAWSAPPDGLTLGPDEVHVWLADLAVDEGMLRKLGDCLDEEERRRARRFAFDEDRTRFVAAHGALRMVLARYIAAAPADLRFTVDRLTKPALAPGYAPGGLRFNISHSGSIALFAVTRSREVGVDVERVRADFECEEISERFFSKREVAAIGNLPIAARVDAFFSCWTRKEAYLKARGLGIIAPLDKFSVSVAPGGPAALLENEIDPSEVSHWSLVNLSPGAGYAGALAVEGHGWRLSCWKCDEAAAREGS